MENDCLCKKRGIVLRGGTQVLCVYLSLAFSLPPKSGFDDDDRSVPEYVLTKTLSSTGNDLSDVIDCSW